MKIVYIEWEDAGSREGWVDTEEADEVENIMCKNVGFLVRKDKQVTVLAAGLAPGLYGDLWTIPTRNITKLDIIKEG